MKEIAKMINQDQKMICAVAKTETNMKKKKLDKVRSSLLHTIQSKDIS